MFKNVSGLLIIINHRWARYVDPLILMVWKHFTRRCSVGYKLLFLREHYTMTGFMVIVPEV